MKAPQRFLMIYLLRTAAAAFANSRTTPSEPRRTANAVLQRAHASSADAHPSSSRPPLTSGHVAFRLARSADVPQIQACNLATLPENYNDSFYRNHMRQWPELALVAEHVPDGLIDEAERDDVTPLRSYLGRVRNAAAPPKKEILGYILGKVEERPILHPPHRRTPSKAALPLYVEGPYNGTPPRWSKPPAAPQWETLGHVTSLAVHSHARRLGIASSLLRQLHYHLHECYSAAAVGLHVRLSNAAAVKLYVETLGYDVADIIPMYYGDGEDAYFMKKELGREDARRERDPAAEKDESATRGQEVPEWVRREARSSFFENRTSLRDALSAEERAWVDRGTGSGRTSEEAPSSSSLTGKVTRSFRTFLSGEEPPRPFVNRRPFGNAERIPNNRPPWETGPEELRLPRYVEIVRSVDVERREGENRESRTRIMRGQAEEGESEEFQEVRSVAASGTG